MAKKKKRFSLLAEVMDLPGDLVTGSGQMLLQTNKKLQVDCCQGILLLTTEEIQLKLANLVLIIQGEGLQIANFSSLSCIVSGSFSAIRFVAQS